MKKFIIGCIFLLHLSACEDNDPQPQPMHSPPELYSLLVTYEDLNTWQFDSGEYGTAFTFTMQHSREFGSTIETLELYGQFENDQDWSDPYYPTYTVDNKVIYLDFSFIFGNSNYVDVALRIKDSNGMLSEYIYVTILRPEGAN